MQAKLHIINVNTVKIQLTGQRHPIFNNRQRRRIIWTNKASTAGIWQKLSLGVAAENVLIIEIGGH